MKKSTIFSTACAVISVVGALVAVWNLQRTLALRDEVREFSKAQCENIQYPETRKKCISELPK